MKENRVNISDEIDAISKEILKNYWLNENEEFRYKIVDLCQKYNLTNFKITELVKNYSSFLKSKTCNICRNDFFEKIETRGKLKGSFWNIECEYCKKAKKQQNIQKTQKINLENENILKSRLLLFNKSFSEKKWEILNENEFEIYQKIIDNKTLKNIKQNIFKNDFFCQSTWTVFNKLEKLNLIIVERNSNKTVLNVYFDERVENIFFKNYKKIDNNDTLSFSLAKKQDKSKQSQPDYSGTFILKNDIILKAGMKYLYGGWLQTDESINLKFTPLENIRENVIQSDIVNEPKLVGDIISKMFNEFEISRTYQNPFDSIENDTDVPF